MYLQYVYTEYFIDNDSRILYPLFIPESNFTKFEFHSGRANSTCAATQNEIKVLLGFICKIAAETNIVICFHIQLYAENHLSMEVTLLNSSSIREGANSTCAETQKNKALLKFVSNCRKNKYNHLFFISSYTQQIVVYPTTTSASKERILLNKFLTYNVFQT